MNEMNSHYFYFKITVNIMIVQNKFNLCHKKFIQMKD